jgi:hypothetical protein
MEGAPAAFSCGALGRRFDLEGPRRLLFAGILLIELVVCGQRFRRPSAFHGGSEAAFPLSGHHPTSIDRGQRSMRGRRCIHCGTALVGRGTRPVRQHGDQNGEQERDTQRYSYQQD